MVIGLFIPAFYHSNQKTSTVLSQFVVPIDNASDANQAFTVAHLETLLQQKHILATNIILVAYGKGIYLLEKGNHFQPRLQALIEKGVQFYTCNTTQATIKNQLFHHIDFIDGVKSVPNGKDYIETLMEQGFTNSFA